MNRAVILIISLSFVFTAVTFWSGNLLKAAEIPRPTLFIFDSDASDRLTRLIANDRGNIYITRLFHNKVLIAGNTFFINLSRAGDLTFLFSLTPESSSYENVGTIQMLFPPEIIILTIAAYAWVVEGKKLWPKYRIIIFILCLSLIPVGMVSPTFYLPKFFPFLVMLRIFMYLIFFEWSKKLSLSR